jgi:hypothetical protein
VGFLKRITAAVSSPPTVDDVDWYRLYSASITSVVGESNYQQCLDKTVRGARTTPPFPPDEMPFESDNEPRPWFAAYLQREPGNTYDANAVSVSSGHGIVGYLDRNAAKRFQPVLQLLESHGHAGGVCPAYALRADNGMWGVVPVLSSASKCTSYVKADKSFRV